MKTTSDEIRLLILTELQSNLIKMKSLKEVSACYTFNQEYQVRDISISYSVRFISFLSSISKF